MPGPLQRRIRELIPYAPDLKDYDLAYRPVAYWTNPAASMLGTVMADHLWTGAMERGEGPLCRPLCDLAPHDQAALERIHPAFMGGAYLPDFDDYEVEIARIVMNSVMSDVISFRARPLHGRIAYRVLDEYMEEGHIYLFEEPPSAEPLSFGEMLVLIATTTRSDYEDHFNPPGSVIDLGKCLHASHFLAFRSAFYPQIGAFFKAEDDIWEAGL